MTVKKVKGGHAVKHCRKGRKGTIKKFKSKRKAVAMHKAIMSKKKKKSTKKRKKKKK